MGYLSGLRRWGSVLAMAGASAPKLVVAFAVLFTLSVGAGYGVGAQVRTDDSTSAAPGASPATEAATTTAPLTVVPDPPASPEEPPTEAPTTLAPTTLAPTTVAPTTVAPTTSTRPGPRVPDREHPLRIALAGDSVMAGLAPPVKAALEADGTAQVRFVLTPSILRDPAVRYTWNTQLAEFDPEIVIMFVGTWESGVIAKGSGPDATSDPNWRTGYERDILDPWVQLITSRGASVVWIANPTVKSDEANAMFGALNAAFRDLPGRWPQVSIVEANPALNGALAGYHDVVALADGTRIRTRQIDGLHLCAGGAALLGRVLVVHLADAFAAPVHDGWETGSWRTESVYPPQSCPAP